jgi:hypothetical protein
MSGSDAVKKGETRAGAVPLQENARKASFCRAHTPDASSHLRMTFRVARAKHLASRYPGPMQNICKKVQDGPTLKLTTHFL